MWKFLIYQSASAKTGDLRIGAKMGRGSPLQFLSVKVPSSRELPASF